MDASSVDADAEVASDAPASDAQLASETSTLVPSDASGFDADAQAVDPRVALILAAASSYVRADGVGAGIALVVDGKLAYAGGLGVRALGGPPVDGDTLFAQQVVTRSGVAVRQDGGTVSPGDAALDGD